MTPIQSPYEVMIVPEVCMNSLGGNNKANSSAVPVLNPSILTALGEITDETPGFDD